ncbi:hypothetical protein ABC345_18250 [Shouchella sp. 1P09AA]|uniref:hypothetical protein n=1 Tax=unclassified Shouchella TaxID=2893065 RepID=UPI0039A3514A
MTVETLTRKEDIKVIESILRKYKTYQAGKENLKNQLHNFSTIKRETDNPFIHESDNKHSKIAYSDFKNYSLIIDSIDIAAQHLDGLESNFVHYRYFENKTMKEISIEMGYGEKHLFNLRKRLLEKLLISLRGLY